MLTPLEALKLAQRYAVAEKIAVSTVGKRAIKNHHIFKRIAAGHSATARTLQQLEVFFLAHWPEAAPWPAEIVPGPLTSRQRRAVRAPADCGEAR
jgi:hypothetical protein